MEKTFLDIKEKVDLIVLDSILFTLVKREDWTLWSLDKAKKIEDLYRKFLVLAATYPHKSIVPTKDIDTFWHTHILDTQKYMEDCEKTFGYYIHHFPYFGLRGKKDEQNSINAFKETCELFQKHFNIDLINSIAGCCSDCRSACGPHYIVSACKDGKDDDKRPKIYY